MLISGNLLTSLFSLLTVENSFDRRRLLHRPLLQFSGRRMRHCLFVMNWNDLPRALIGPIMPSLSNDWSSHFQNLYLQREPECELLRMGIASQPETRMGPLPLPLRALFPPSFSVFGSVCVHRSTFLLSAWPPECELAHLCPRRPLKVRLSRFLLLFLTLSRSVQLSLSTFFHFFYYYCGIGCTAFKPAFSGCSLLCFDLGAASHTHLPTHTSQHAYTTKHTHIFVLGRGTLKPAGRANYKEGVCVFVCVCVCVGIDLSGVCSKLGWL